MAILSEKNLPSVHSDQTGGFEIQQCFRSGYRSLSNRDFPPCAYKSSPQPSAAPSPVLHNLVAPLADGHCSLTFTIF